MTDIRYIDSYVLTEEDRESDWTNYDFIRNAIIDAVSEGAEEIIIGTEEHEYCVIFVGMEDPGAIDDFVNFWIYMDGYYLDNNLCVEGVARVIEREEM